MLKEEYAVRLARRVPLTSSVQEYKMTKQASQPGMLTRKTTPASSAQKFQEGRDLNSGRDIHASILYMEYLLVNFYIHIV